MTAFNSRIGKISHCALALAAFVAAMARIHADNVDTLHRAAAVGIDTEVSRQFAVHGLD